jgi:hypothetical protein
MGKLNVWKTLYADAQADSEYIDRNLLYTPMSVQVWPTQIFQGRREDLRLVHSKLWRSV